MRRFLDLMLAAPAVMLLAYFAKAAGFGALPIFLLPLWGMYLLGRVHGMRAIADRAQKPDST